MAVLNKIVVLLLLVTTYLASGAQSLGTTLVEGDVYIELIASVYSKSRDNGTCYDVDVESVQNVEAVRWVLTELNKYHALAKNKGIGLRVSKTCGSVNMAENLMVDLTVEMKNSQQQNIIGVLGPDTSSQAEAVSRLLDALPADFRLPVVGYSTTAQSLSDRERYGNFLRTIPSDSLQTKTITSFMKSVDWTRMALVHEDDAYGNGGRDSLLEEAKRPDLCFPVTIAISQGDDRQMLIETQVAQKIINSSVPIDGILVYGQRELADSVKLVVNNILGEDTNASRPVFLFSEANGGNRQNYSSDKAVYVLSPPQRAMTEFQEAFNGLFRNLEGIYDLPKPYKQWMKDVYKDRFGCELPLNIFSNVCPVVNDTEISTKLPPSVYDGYAIQGALVLAEIERKVRQQLCPDLNFCASLFTSSRQVYLNQTKQLTVNMDSFTGVKIAAFQNPDLVLEFADSTDATIPSGMSLYEVYQRQKCGNNDTDSCLIKVAYMTPDDFVVDTQLMIEYDEGGIKKFWPNITKPQCPDGYLCSECIDQTVVDFTILFEPGDMYIVGVVPVHHPGNSPLQCGTIIDGHLDMVEAMRFAITEAKLNFADKIPTGAIGAIIIDSCNDPAIVQERILSIHRLGVYRDGAHIPVAGKILGYIGGFTSDVSTIIADITTRLGYIQISYASTSSSLSSRQKFPNFLRTPSSDTMQVMEMLRIVKEIGVDLIQIIYSDTLYGINGKSAIEDQIDSMGICIAKVHKRSLTTKTADLITELRKAKEAQVVILFLGGLDMEIVVPELNAGLDKGEFIFVGSDGWGVGLDVRTHTNLIGSITLTPELPISETFTDYLKTLQADGTDANNWIRPYLENYFRCYFETSFNKSSGMQCKGDERLDVHRTGYRVDVWAPFAQRAVIAILQGARKVLDQGCRQSTHVCGAFYNNTSLLVDALKEVTLRDDSGNLVPVFDDNGDGRAGYKFYVLEIMEGRVQYNRIGTSHPAFAFDSQSYSQLITVESTCNGQAVCRKCFPSTIQGEETTAYPAWLIALFVIALLGFIALAAFFGFICYRRGCCLQLENGRLKLDREYLTPLYNPPRRTNTSRGAKGNEGKEESDYYTTITSIISTGETGQNQYACPRCQHCACRTSATPNTNTGDANTGSNAGANTIVNKEIRPVPAPREQIASHGDDYIYRGGRPQPIGSTTSYAMAKIPSYTADQPTFGENISDDINEEDEAADAQGHMAIEHINNAYVNELEEPQCVPNEHHNANTAGYDRLKK